MNVIHGDCLEVIPTMEADSIDAIITDPPYGLSFMGKAWDHGVPGVPFWAEALRVAKPGAHLLAFGGTRTFHRLTVAIEDAGWEIRDSLSWLYGSGFPKSLDVSKAIDKAAGVQPIGGRPPSLGMANNPQWNALNRQLIMPPTVTDAARQWEGWGTALKPAWEPIIMARKPLTGTVAANVQEHGTGAINVDVCRIEASGRPHRVCHGEARPSGIYGDGAAGSHAEGVTNEGRWPANVVLDEEAGAMLDAMTGEVGAAAPASGPTRSGYNVSGSLAGYRNGTDKPASFHNDTGGASRFFYCAKASRSERDAGLDAVEHRQRDEGRKEGNPGGDNPRNRGVHAVANSHPTVKPIALMRWLCRLVTPPNGLILDPFTGSGSTGCAALAEGFRFIGIEKEPEYAEIARRRLEAATSQGVLL